MTAIFNNSRSHETLNYIKIETIVLSCIWMPIFIIGFLGNILVCVTVYKTKKMHIFVYYLLTSMAISDAMSCIFCALYLVFQFCYIYLDLLVSTKSLLCQIDKLMIYTSYYTSTHTLTVISLERYYAIVRNRVVLKKNRLGFAIIGLTWILGFAITIPMVYVVGVTPQSPYLCDYVYIATTNSKIYITALTMIEVVIPFTIITYFYSTIIRYVKSRLNSISSFASIDKSSDRNKRDAIRMLTIVTVIFIVFSFFLHCTKMVMAFSGTVMISTYESGLPNFYIYGDGLAVLLNVINPFIYSVCNKSFRQSMLQTIKRKRRKIMQFPVKNPKF
ncbi:Neuropeptide Y receptor [Trichoplax sp. H2]|nr:Neuropeptide Y receptor [Trichoplax sp. H2]|eukprot:RDD36701.1 Neuropeptide Y receptor [Trichoplax sp. H2]